jgi:hypothetical protein
MGLLDRMREAGGENEQHLHAGSENGARRLERKERRHKRTLQVETPVEVEYTNPGDLLAMMMKSNSVDSELGIPTGSKSDAANPELREETRRKPIISINGRDVDEDDIDRAA